MRSVAKPQENFSDLVLFRAILGPFQHLLKPLFEASGWCLYNKNNKKMANFTSKMILKEFQIHSASKITHLQVHCKDFCHYDTFADIEKQVENMIKSGQVENRQMTQGLTSKHLFFPVCFFPHKCQNSLACLFLISHLLSPITHSYF